MDFTTKPPMLLYHVTFNVIYSPKIMGRNDLGLGFPWMQRKEGATRSDGKNEAITRRSADYLIRKALELFDLDEEIEQQQQFSMIAKRLCRLIEAPR